MLFLTSAAATLAVLASAGTAILLAEGAHRQLGQARAAAEQRFAAARIRADVWHVSQNITQYLLTGEEAARKEFAAEVEEARENLETLTAPAERQTIGRALEHLARTGAAAMDARDAGGDIRALLDDVAAARAAAVDRVKAAESRLKETALALDAGASQARRRSGAATLAAGLAGVTVTGLLLLAARRRVLQSVRGLSRQAAALGRGDLVEAARPTGGRDEIAAAQADLAQGAGQLGDLLRFLEQSTGAFDAAARQLEEKGRSLRVSADRIEAGAADAEGVAQGLGENVRNVARAVEGLCQTVSGVAQGADSLAARAEELEGIAPRLAEGAGQLATAVAALDGAVAEMRASASRSGQALAEQGALFERIAASAVSLREAWQGLAGRLAEIAGLVNSIREVSDQTELLALNAAIEAARAGEHGRGFAVVAEEVRSLAEKARRSSDEVENLIAAVREDSRHVEDMVAEQAAAVTQGQAATGLVTQAMGRVEEAVARAGPAVAAVGRVAASLKEQADAVAAAAAEVGAAAQQNAAAAEGMKNRGEEIRRSVTEAGEVTQEGVRRLQAVLEDTAAAVQLTVSLFPEIERLLAVREGMVRIRELRLPETTAAYMPWREEYATGVRAMDAEHRELVRLINVTHSAMMTGSGLEEAVRGLLAYAEGHLRHEEEFMQSMAYPDLPRHKAIHDRLLQRARAMAEDLRAGRARPLDLLNFLREWLNGHIVAEDRLYGLHVTMAGGAGTNPSGNGDGRSSVPGRNRPAARAAR